MSRASKSRDRVLYVVSCRKPDVRRTATASDRDDGARLMTAPKRAGTYMLLSGPLDLNIKEARLVPDPNGDTDAGEQKSHRGRPAQRVEWQAWQHTAELNIARRLWELGPLALYVHGYNTSPEEALQGAVKLQLAFDARNVRATVVLFTWPSQGHLLDYFPDQKAAGRFGSYALINLLMSLRATQPEGMLLHVVAHSLGGYVVTRALSAIAVLHLDRGFAGDAPLVAELAYMNPDVDYDALCSGYSEPGFDSPSYLEIADGYAATALAERVTIYCTTNDVALFASLFKNRTKRLGAYGPGLERARDRATVMKTRIRPNVYVVNCDDFCVFDADPRHSHSHFIDCPAMLNDLGGVIAREPADAFTARVTTDAPRWFRLRFHEPSPAPKPGLLRAMAAFWSSLGTLGVNQVAVWLVRAKKWVQRVSTVPMWIALVTLTTGSGMMAVIRQQRVWWWLAWVIVVPLVVYIVLWVRERAVQRFEDRAVAPAHVESQ
jgi:esterase/lipase superfamily enzyme